MDNISEKYADSLEERRNAKLQFKRIRRINYTLRREKTDT